MTTQERLSVDIGVSMNNVNQPNRYIPLTHPGLENPILLLDSQASLQDLHALADLRVTQATRCLDTLVNLKDLDPDEHDLTAIAGTAHALMLQACDVNRLIEKRLWANGAM
jgi:hypothetical protein